MGCSSISFAILVVVCLTVSSSTGVSVNPPSRISQCKTKCSKAWLLCRTRVAKTPKERLECAELFATTFPSCYFGLEPSKVNCEGSILESFSKCVLGSLSYGESFSCAIRKSMDLKKCKSASSKREQADDSSNTTDACNQCFGDYESCISQAFDEAEHDLCVVAKSLCPLSCWPPCLHFAAPPQNSLSQMITF